MPADSQIFKATYSGIPVYEMMCKGVAVMRRREDSWLNATQILKVAGFDKPQRTRILEREVQKGTHEKVQGGYGKYQGTWIPLERGVALCHQYNCESLLRPIVQFQPDEKSPPLAPKHLVAAPTIASKPATRRSEVPAAPSAVSTRSSRRNVRDVGDMSDHDTMSLRGSDDGSMTPSPSEASSSSRTPSPIRSSPGLRSISNIDDDRSPSPPHRKRKYRQDGLDKDIPSLGINGYPMRDSSSYGDQILEYFISDTNQIPNVLINPPSDFDPNMAIDDDGHTALHWASAMGRIRVVKLLLTAGADIFRTNKAGQTALMRSVMFANNYDVRKFPELYELLHRSILNIDNNNRTVFHHIVDVAMSKGKTHAARYYMEAVLNRLAAYPTELADVVNFQDEDGETALTLAARCRSKRLIKLLIDHGADPKIRNRDGKTAEDYILEDERFRSSPIIPVRDVNAPLRTSQPFSLAPSPLSASPFPFPIANGGDRPSLHYSSAAQKAATRCVSEVATLFENLAGAYDQELREKDRDSSQASGLLQSIQTEILDDQRSVSALKTQAEPLQHAKERLAALEGELRGKMGRRYRYGWEKWIRDETEREKTLRDASSGELPVPMQTDGPDSALRAPNGEDISDLYALYQSVPAEPEALKEACERLRQELQEHNKRRAELFDALVAAQADAGTGGRMAEYRRLIGAGCGGVAPGDVDNVVTMLLETLESEEPSSSTPWNMASGAK